MISRNIASNEYILAFDKRYIIDINTPCIQFIFEFSIIYMLWILRNKIQHVTWHCTKLHILKSYVQEDVWWPIQALLWGKRLRLVTTTPSAFKTPSTSSWGISCWSGTPIFIWVQKKAKAQIRSKPYGLCELLKRCWNLAQVEMEQEKVNGHGKKYNISNVPWIYKWTR